jgi:hypothetical protein
VRMDMRPFTSPRESGKADLPIRVKHLTLNYGAFGLTPPDIFAFP